MNLFLFILPLIFYNIETIKNNYILLTLSYSHKTIFIWGSTLLNIIVYWSVGLFYLMIDFFRIKKFKIQNKNYPLYTTNSDSYLLNWNLLYTTIKTVLFNQIIINPIIAYMIYYCTYININIGEKPFPSSINIIYDVFKSLLIVEFAFYYMHRILHIPFVYKHIHSIHHTYSAPIAISALYSHPIEYIFSNIIPVVLGPLLCQSHLFTFLLFQFIAIVNTVSVHSGYKIPFLINPTTHDIHHMKYKYNFGVIDILDRIHGTYLYL
jgi:sterol desaturase/sphingolipid hydroxylase (fatty acid hydroxylase superfamily)